MWSSDVVLLDSPLIPVRGPIDFPNCDVISHKTCRCSEYCPIAELFDQSLRLSLVSLTFR